LRATSTLVEYVRDNDDGTVTVNAVMNDQEKADLAADGFQIGATIEDHKTWLERRAERDEALAAEERRTPPRRPAQRRRPRTPSARSGSARRRPPRAG